MKYRLVIKKKPFQLKRRYLVRALQSSKLEASVTEIKIENENNFGNDIEAFT